MVKRSLARWSTVGPLLLTVAVLVTDPGVAKENRRVKKWRGEMSRIDGLLREAAWAEAQKASTKLAHQMTQEITGGWGVGPFLGAVSGMRALAAAGLGDRDEALWHWRITQQLFPDMELDLAAYGKAGQVLEEASPLSELAKRDGLRAGITPPQRKRAPKPRMPPARRGVRVSVVVECIIGSDGLPREPRIIRANGETTLVYIALDSLRHWEFKPAMFGGNPITSAYNLTVNFGG